MSDQPPPERLQSLDVFRGLTVASMLLVNNPGSWSAIYPPLGHAKWHGWTPTDLIFPFFLFIVGITTHISISRRLERGDDRRALVRKIVRRGLLIVLLGLLLNWYPFFWWGRIPDLEDPTLWQRVVWRFEHLRWAGVLQRIGIVYIAAALLSLRTTVRQQAALAAAILVGYWALLTMAPVPSTGQIGAALLDQPDKTLQGWVDRAVLGADHIYASTKTWDPEGLLSTLPAIVTALLGILAGRWLLDTRRSLGDRIAGLSGAGSLAMVAGLFWGWIFPINKGLWTSSYVVFTAGFACLVLATCVWLVDHLQVRGWTRPFVVYGVNPLVAFVASGIMSRTIYTLIRVPFRGKQVSLQQVSYEFLFAPWLTPRMASLLWGLSFVVLWWAILSLLYRRNLIVKV